MVIWSIWHSGNDKLWNDLDTPSSQIVCNANLFHFEWFQARASPHCISSLAPSVPVTTWSHPPFGCYKCNVDASFFKDSGVTGFGLCIRDDQGTSVFARTAWVPHLLPISLGEAMGLLQALEWVVDNVCFEIDCKVVVDSLLTINPDISEYGVIISNCHWILSSFPLYKVEFVRRLNNRVAHNLAKVTPFQPSPQVFYHVSSCITSLISNEMV